MRRTHCSRGRPRFGQSVSNRLHSPSEVASRSRSIGYREPRGRHNHLVNNIHGNRRPTTRFGLIRGNPGGGAPLGFTTSAKTFTSWPAPFPVTSDSSSILYVFVRTLESKNDRVCRERSPFVICHDNVLNTTNNTTGARSRTQFCWVPCLVPATYEIKTLLLTKSKRQICALGSNAHGVE